MYPSIPRPRALMVLIVLLAAGAGFSLLSPASPVAELHLSGRTMGTTYSVKYRPTHVTPSLKAMQIEVDALLAEINHTMSTYDQESELSRLNRLRTTNWVPASAPLRDVLKAALEIGAQSEGAFDITVGPLVNLWGFGPEVHPDRIPLETDIAAAHARSGLDKVTLSEAQQAIRKHRPDVFLDLSGIAKGYGVDRVAELMTAHGIEHYMVEIGGEIRVRGFKEQDTPWRIAIEKPLSSERSVHTMLALSDIALATSGNYRNFFEIAGRRYSHTIDPTTGWPVDNHLVSVTVLAETSMRADAWATAFQVLGPERGMAIAERLNLPVLFVIDRDGQFEERACCAFQRYRKQELS
ncbi:MAG: FAD:protein FMN transferase [Nitrospira sp.]|nr:FAD:protein FMN transferase [Nitrospira sp.]MDH4371512.1 FAD:protein FMN transferase [Nitrospira sp.]MDH5347738.1 FAD:protein FMN transferase [Nitrospira sp.]MDH5499072.1 FAD:protein FMN transferase [Nitrospira sp.]MDH5723863.1 FAD:protein FMN transferase [Nitrospira sp.]